MINITIWFLVFGILGVISNIIQYGLDAGFLSHLFCFILSGLLGIGLRWVVINV